MPEERPLRKQLEEFGPIVDKLIAVIGASHEAFIHQRSQLLAQIMDQREPLHREIGSAMDKLNEQATAKTGGEREACLRLHSLLTHLQRIAETIGRIEETLRKQIGDRVLFSDKAISQTSHLFYQQEEILRYLADVMRGGGEGIRRRAVEECRKLGQSCLQFANDHENRLVEGLCLPQAGPLFLAILDQMQTVIHHELEAADLLGNNC